MCSADDMLTHVTWCSCPLFYVPIERSLMNADNRIPISVLEIQRENKKGFCSGLRDRAESSPQKLVLFLAFPVPCCEGKLSTLPFSTDSALRSKGQLLAKWNASVHALYLINI